MLFDGTFATGDGVDLADGTKRLAGLLANPNTEIKTSGNNDKDHTHAFTTANGGGVASPTEYTPLHYVINYIIYKGPLGA